MYWYNGDIEWLEKKEVPNTSQKKVVFLGSSSFTRWETMEKDFKDFQAINLGFGGSTLAACAWFYHRIVPRLQPDAIVIYAGDNDIGDGRTPEEVVIFYYQLIDTIRKTLGNIPVCFVSIKLSPSRKHLKGSIEYANQCIRESIERSKNNVHYIDIYPKMLDKNGELKLNLYESDLLHLSPVGYLIWQKAISSKLTSLLK